LLLALGGLFSADLGCLGPPYLQLWAGDSLKKTAATHLPFFSRSACSSQNIPSIHVLYLQSTGVKLANLRQISTSSLPGQALPMFRGLMEGSNTEMADVVVVPWVG